MRVIAPLAVAFLVIAGSATPAAAQDGGPTLELRVDGDRVIVDLVSVGEPVGALSLTVGGFATLTETCSLASGMGACNFADDGLQVVGLNPTGWENPALLIDVAVSGIEASGVWLRVNQATDVNGIDLPTQVVGSAPAPPPPTEVPVDSGAVTDETVSLVPASAEESGGTPWGLLLAGTAVVALVAAAVATRSRRSVAELD